MDRSRKPALLRSTASANSISRLEQATKLKQILDDVLKYNDGFGASDRGYSGHRQESDPGHSANRAEGKFEKICSDETRFSASYLICTSLDGSARDACSRWSADRARKSIYEIWWTQEIVHSGAQPFLVRYSRRISATVYCASGLAGITALLRAVVHQPVLAYIQVAGAGPAAPIAGPAVGDVVLEIIELREVLLLKSLHLQEHGPLPLADRPQLPVAVVDDPDRGGEPEFQARRPTTSASSGLWMPPPSTELMFT